MIEPPPSGNLTIRQLELFAVASRAGSFSEAARALGISQPSLSASIAKMERQLRVALFDRSGSGVALTPEGARFAPAAADLIRVYTSTIHNLRNSESAGRRVAFAVAPTLGASVASEAIAALSVSDPDLRVALHDIGRQQSIQLLLDGVIDFAVMVEAPALAQLERQSIGTSYFVAAFAPSSPLCGQSRVGWTDLAPHPLILAGDLRQRGLLQSMWEGEGADLRPAYEVEELATGAGLAAQGLGYVLLPNVLVTPQTMPRLRSARLDCPQLVRPLEVVHLRSRPLLPQAHSLVEALRAAAARLAD